MNPLPLLVRPPKYQWAHITPSWGCPRFGHPWLHPCSQTSEAPPLGASPGLRCRSSGSSKQSFVCVWARAAGDLLQLGNQRSLVELRRGANRAACYSFYCHMSGSRVWVSGVRHLRGYVLTPVRFWECNFSGRCFPRKIRLYVDNWTTRMEC